MGALGRLLGSSSTISGVASGLTSTASLSVSMGAPERKNGSCSGNRRMRRRGGVILAAMSAEQMQPATVRGEQMQPSTVRGEQMQRAMCAEFTVLATITVRRSKKEDFKDRISNRLDAMAEIVGRNVSLMLISTDIDLETKAAKQSIEAPVKRWFEKRKSWWDKDEEEKETYTVEFTVDSNFGTPGAIVVTNRHQREFFLESIAVEGFASGAVHFNCNSWVQSSTKDGPGKRVFFSDKPYLPSETPAGLKKLREEELKALRGDGTGERKCSDRIYDFDTYNDLGNPDRGKDWVRPTLGGRDIPYPRRLRTGRPPMKTDLQAESRVEAPLPMYVPRDEAFEEGKQETLDKQNIKAILHVLVPSLVSTSEECHDFKDLHEMDGLYKVGLNFKNGLQTDLLKKIPFFDKLHESEAHFRYDTPSILTKDKLAWIRDDEFARQVVAGINPVSIERVKVFPPVSKLDPELYGPPESAIREEDIAGFLDGMSVADAVKENKLFMLDYHDIFLPFLDRINSQDGRKSYATRTLFFLTSLGTLKPVAIELCLPPGTSESRLKRVLTPPVDATSSWIWQLAKAHVCSNDAGVHQLINHWLRTHASMEPFILAAHRQLSALHPIYKLLQPHMRYTLGINSLARQILINGKGVIESYFTPGSVSMEMSAAAYRTMYRFDQENLPDDLIRRGMAVPDPTQPHGLKLLMEDYPYANDGLMIWSAIENWVTTYVNAHYHDDASIEYDVELQHWYSEAVNVGHADVGDKPWWPRLSTSEDLIRILTTVIWVSSAQHAALNFGQYPLGGYMPNRPPLMRRLIPDETDPVYKNFLDNPEKFFLSCLPSMMQATKLMTVIDTLSTHSEDEEYLGERGKQTYSWTPEIAEAFNEYATEIRRVEEEIEKRNRDSELRNRCGAGVLPYQLLMPSSGPGITARGIPIVPGIMPINNYRGFIRMTGFCKTKIPAELTAALEPIKDNEEAVRAYGIHLGTEMCKKILASGIKTLHLYTLNMEKSALAILMNLGLIEESKITRSLPWRPPTNVFRVKEDVRPIFWANRPKSYISRTVGWEQYPHGRWSDSKNPSYGALTDHQFLRPRSRDKKLQQDWAIPLKCFEDIYERFANFCLGKLSSSPWSDLEGLQPETKIIDAQLGTINQKGFLSINSQPAVNGEKSDSPSVGWGGSGGYVYQKAYLEFFCTEEKLNSLIEKCKTVPSLLLLQ